MTIKTIPTKQAPPRTAAFLVAAGCALTALSGCAHVHPEKDFARTRDLIAKTTGVQDTYNVEDPAMTDEQLNEILADGLTADEAVRIALLNNRRIQSGFMAIGVAKADWVQSGLFSNPTLSIAARLPEGGGRANIDAAISQSIVEIWQIPERKRIAQANLDRTVLKIAHDAATIATDTMKAYYQALAAAKLLEVANQNEEIVTRSFVVVQTLREAGTASALDESLAKGQSLSAELGVRQATLTATTAKRNLAKYLSLKRDLAGVPLTDKIHAHATIPDNDEEFIKQAGNNRLDLQAAAMQVTARLREIGLEKISVIPELSLGLAFERLEGRAKGDRDILANTIRSSIPAGRLTAPPVESRRARRDGESATIDSITGPSLSITLPIYDQNQAQIARAKYVYESEVRIYEALIIDIAQEIRIAADTARTATENATYYDDQVVPQAEQNLQFASDSFEAGQTGILILLEAQRTALEAHRGGIAAHQQAATAIAHLSQTIGTPLEHKGH